MTQTDILEITFEGAVIRAINEGGRYFYCASDVKKAIDFEKNHYQDVNNKDKIKVRTYSINADGSKGCLKNQIFITIKGITDLLKCWDFEIKQRLLDYLMFEANDNSLVVAQEFKFDEKESAKFESVFRDTERINDLTLKISKLRKLLEQEMNKPTKEEMYEYLRGSVQ